MIAPARSGAAAIKLAVGNLEGWSVGQQAADPLAELPSQYVVHYDPNHCFEIDSIADADPKAKFLFVSRATVDVLASSMVAWRSGKFVTEPDLDSWWGEKWSFQLVPEWKELIGKPLMDVVGEQYFSSLNSVITSLEKLPRNRWSGLHFESLSIDPGDKIKTALKTLGFNVSEDAVIELQLSQNVISKPSANKWHKNSQEILGYLTQQSERVSLVNKFRAQFGDLPPVEMPSRNEKIVRDEKKPSVGTAFASSFTSTLVELLKKAEASLVISTYKSGHLITARVDGETINTSFQSMNKPMGIATAGSRLAVGTRDSVRMFANHPGLANKLKSIHPPTHVFADKAEIITGDVAIHEMAYGTQPEDRNLYFVNTSFSCIATLDFDYSWVPVWRPSWISAYSPEDRCHLNGLTLVDGKPKYVTALAQTDTAHGWRELKGTSGVIIDVATDRVITTGLAMPHSPRWHQGKLWVLESGKGTLATVDLESGSVTTIATLPGFTRGLAFIGKYALVGLSQVRESVFNALPVTDSKEARNCGVWVVDTEQGRTIGFLRFDGAVQEIFDVAVINGAKWPEFIPRSDSTAGNFTLPEPVIRNFKPARARAAR